MLQSCILPFSVFNFDSNRNIINVKMIWEVHQSRGSKKRHKLQSPGKMGKDFPLCDLFFGPNAPALNFKGVQIVPECTEHWSGCASEWQSCDHFSDLRHWMPWLFPQNPDISSAFPRYQNVIILDFQQLQTIPGLRNGIFFKFLEYVYSW